MKSTRLAHSARGASAILVVAAILASAGALPFDGRDSFAPTDTPPRPGARNLLANDAATPQDSVSFAEDILPIFRARCAECHGAEDENGEVRTEVSLNLLEYEKVMAGSEFGTVIEAGDPDGSFLMDMIVAGDMPETGDPVPEDEIALIRAWIEAGAPNN